jgi:hypothetical protein
MRRPFAIAAITAGLALAACGSDGDSGSDAGSDLPAPQAAAAQSAIESAAAEGFTLDEDCVNDLAAQLSDDDAVKAAEGGEGMSPDGEALTGELVSCADPDELIDGIIAAMGGGGVALDEDCAREALEGLDLGSLAGTSGDQPPAEFTEALRPCFDE